MKFLHRNITEKTQWENYKELELIPDSIPESQGDKRAFAFGLDRVWKVLIVALTRELVYEQQVEYLQRCWDLNDLEPNTDKKSHTWQQLWILMN